MRPLSFPYSSGPSARPIDPQLALPSERGRHGSGAGQRDLQTAGRMRLAASLILSPQCGQPGRRFWRFRPNLPRGPSCLTRRACQEERKARRFSLALVAVAKGCNTLSSVHLRLGCEEAPKQSKKGPPKRERERETLSWSFANSIPAHCQ